MLDSTNVVVTATGGILVENSGSLQVNKPDMFWGYSRFRFDKDNKAALLFPRVPANEVDAMRSPGLAKKIAAGTKEGRWVVWKDYSHCAPDWDDIIKLGFPGMRDRLLANWKDAPYYHARRIAADATVRPSSPRGASS